jgi:hypothetical protein
MLRAIAGLIVGVVSVLLILTTVPKLYEMFQIKGWIPGGRPQQVTITAKLHQTPEQSPDGREVYWIAWNGGDINRRGAHRTNMVYEQWTTAKVGDPLEIVYIPLSGDTYLRDGIYVSFGNFAFDVLLLILELLGISFAIRVLRQKTRAWRRRRDA